MISNILATDMKKHFELIKLFEIKVKDEYKDENYEFSIYH